MKSGVTTNTAERYVFGPGEVYINFDEDTLTGTSLGATRGGAEFDLGREQRTIEVDGVLGPVKGNVKLSKVTPTLTVRLLEITEANLKAIIAGATNDVDGNVIGGEISDSTYLTNVVLVAEGSNGDDMIVVLENALPTAVKSISFPDQGEAVLEVTFTAHFDPADLETEPWHITPITEAS